MESNLNKTRASQCSFCQRNRDQVDRLTPGPGGMAICDDCIGLYRRDLEEITEKPPATTKLIRVCTACSTRSPARHHYCFNCGSQFPQET